MKFGIIGSGIVARTIGAKLVELGHEVMISSRDLKGVKKTPMGELSSVNDWVNETGATGNSASGGSFSEAAKFGEAVFNCSSGIHSLEALSAAGSNNLKGKIIVDVSNPLDFSAGFPPTLSVCNTDSLGEMIQRQFPDTKVVKALNMVSAPVMVNPAAIKGDHDLFIAGNDEKAKAWVTSTLLREWLGWKSVIDLGDISNARGLEMYLALWVRLYGAFQQPMFNIHVAKAGTADK